MKPASRSPHRRLLGLVSRTPIPIPIPLPLSSVPPWPARPFSSSG